MKGFDDYSNYFDFYDVNPSDTGFDHSSDFHRFETVIPDPGDGSADAARARMIRSSTPAGQKASRDRTFSKKKWNGKE